MAAVKALAGDADAAWGLFLYSTGEPFDRERANYWLKVAADNRNASALYEFGARLSASSNPCRVLRGIYFLELALKSTPEDEPRQAAGLRSEIERTRQKVRKMPNTDCLRADAILEPLKAHS